MSNACTYYSGINGLSSMQNVVSSLQKKTENIVGKVSYKDILASLQTENTSKVDAVKSTAEMTMEEYQTYIWEKIDSFLFSPTRPYDEETIKISDKCWERMKNDPKYEDKMMNIIKDGRMYQDPFFGTGMNSGGVYWILEFDGGEGCYSHGFSKNFGGSASSARSQFDRESEGGFWSTRSQKRKKQAEMDKILFAKRKMLQEINNEIAYNRHINLKAASLGEKSEYIISGMPAKFLLDGLMGPL